MIHLEQVSLDAPGHPKDSGKPPRLLDRITTSIRSSEYVCLVGPNGSGKSLLLQALAGLRTPSAGEVVFDRANTSAGRGPTIGLVLQNPDEQIVGGTVERDLAFGLENQGVEPAEIRRRVDEALETADLSADARRPPHLLSDGEKQRLALASALILRPDLLLLDEPTSRLDPPSRMRFRASTRAAGASTGRTVVHVTHRSEEIVTADRVLGLREGRLVFDGSPADLVDSPEADRLGILWSALHRFRRAAARSPVPSGAAGPEWNEVPV